MSTESDAMQIIQASPELRKLHLPEDEFRLTSTGILRNIVKLAFAQSPLLAPDRQIPAF